MITLNQFISDVMSLIEECPKCWRKGQSVFNIVDSKYGVARDVQFKDGIDCFYVDDQIEPFLKAAYKRLQAKCENS